MNNQELKSILDKYVEWGFLKKIGNKYKDSDVTTELLKEGISRDEIGKNLMEQRI